MDYTITEKLEISPERRRGGDRRANSFPRFKYWGRQGRRREIRRRDEMTKVYLDWHPPHLLWVALAILCLGSIDALFTLSLLQRGAVEINPFMAVLIDTSIPLFVGVKMTVMGLGLVCLVVHQNFTLLRLFRVRQFIYGFLLLYTGLVVYESLLLLAEPFLVS